MPSAEVLSHHPVFDSCQDSDQRRIGHQPSLLENQNCGNMLPSSSFPSSSSDVSSLEADNARLRHEVHRLKNELNRLRAVPLSMKLPPRSVSLQVPPRRRGSDDDENNAVVMDGEQSAHLYARSWHRPLHSRSATATSAPLTMPMPMPPPRDVESHQSSQGLHHRRAGTTTATSYAGPSTDEATTTRTRANRRGRGRVAVTGGGANDDDGNDDSSTDHELGHEDDSVSCAAEASFVSTSFCSRVKDRAGWLVGLLVLQSMSSFIISRNEALLQSHLVIVQFLTMLVGSGGNAGNQAAVQAIRGLATGAVHEHNAKNFLVEELKMGVTLSAILGVAGLLRTAAFAVPLAETVAITMSLCTIVFISIVLGACLPLGMLRLGIDPAHSSTTIQVLMDILGVSITVLVSGAILDSPVHSGASQN